MGVDVRGNELGERVKVGGNVGGLELLLKSRRSPTYAEGDSTLSLRPPMEAGTDQVKQDSKHVFVLSFPEIGRAHV